MRLYESSAGLGGLVLCLMDLYTGARWGELVGQERHDYDEINRAIGIREPLKEVGGKLLKGGDDVTAARTKGPVASGRRPPRRRKRGAGTKTPESTRWVQLPSGIAVLYELLLEQTGASFVFVSPEGRPWYRSNFRERYWRPAWDGVNPDDPKSDKHVPAVLPWFTFHEGRHTHSTWLAQDHVPEVARRSRLGHKMRGMGRVYEHVTPEMERQVLDVLERRWLASLLALKDDERAQLLGWLPHLGLVIEEAKQASEDQEAHAAAVVDLPNFSQSRPKPRLHDGDRASDLRV